MMIVRGVARAAVVAAMVLLAAAAAQAITIDMVTVGNPGNVADIHVVPGGPLGAVAYTYNIGKYEVTAGQYTAFLNAVGGVDTYRLYNTLMASPNYGEAGSGIAQSGGGTVGNPYTYSVDSNFVNRPVNHVSFWDACRFVNWLSNGQPTGAQDAGTTERGTYTLDGYNGTDGRTIQRNANATWALTSEDEWYKAAYYDPVTGTYFDYPTSSDTAPGRDMADASGNNANWHWNSGTYPIDSPYYTTVAGEFQNSVSPYGTFDQGGNLWEMNETIIHDSYRGIRGGSYDSPDGWLDAGNPYCTPAWYCLPTFEVHNEGFRVSEVPGPVPEPVTMATVGLGIAGLGGYIRRRMAR